MDEVATPEPPGVARVRDSLVLAGSPAQLLRLPGPAPTAAAAAAQLGCTPAQIVNSLVLEADGEPLLVLASGAHRVDTALLAATLGVGAVRRAPAERVHEVTGQRVGGVAPIGHPSPLRTVVDEDLRGAEQLWAGGGDAHWLLALSYPELVRLTGAAVHQVR